MASTPDRHLGPLPNFAQILLPDDWASFAAAASTQKNPMPAGVHRVLGLYAEGERVSVDGTTFRHIVDYLATGDEDAQPARLGVACADFGYTLDELRAFRASGVTGQSVAAEVVRRGVRGRPARFDT